MDPLLDFVLTITGLRFVFEAGAVVVGTLFRTRRGGRNRNALAPAGTLPGSNRFGLILANLGTTKSPAFAGLCGVPWTPSQARV